MHVVGGAVRDLLLGRAPRELDLVVEGDAWPSRARAAARLGGTVVVHPRFGTATVHAGGVAFDLAGARAERYARPGALPDVRLGVPLREDLARRDFTRQRDRPAARRRRAHRLAGRAGGPRGGPRCASCTTARSATTRPGCCASPAMPRGSASRWRSARTRWLARAVAGGAPATVSGERLGAELRLLAREPQPAALAALERHGLGAARPGPAFAAPPGARGGRRGLCPPEARADLAALAAAVCGARARGRSPSACARWRFPRRRRP